MPEKMLIPKEHKCTLQGEVLTLFGCGRVGFEAHFGLKACLILFGSCLEPKCHFIDIQRFGMLTKDQPVYHIGLSE